MTSCADMKLLMHGLLDGELDAANALKCDEHLATCTNCAAEYETYRSLRQAIRTHDVSRRAPDALRSRVLAALDAAEEAPTGQAESRRAVPRRPDSWRRWTIGASGLALAASLALFIATPFRGPDPVNELVAGHVRSLQVDHLTDVQTSDQHTVKPWFAGKLDFSPPVVDLTSAGFPLVGGRLDYVSGRAVAALVFRRREHVINVFIWPGSEGAQPASSPDHLSREGYNVLHWTENGMTLWAVSDLNASELREFGEAFRAQTRS
ncbi:anti-sigma factor family protein [Microvirga massiliensis]|uniref:anti-sigma factor family protein n=1 Tax=Microvirga massiliensis TaxID=1033741 RepID=UPI00062B56D8|nr:anti-sigma factor [Microvirga massiliensis]